MPEEGEERGHPVAAVLTVGDELLLGRTVDTNAAWLGRALADLGVPVVERATVGDDDPAIRDAASRLLERVDLLVVTGGLGPTEDDRTRPAVAGLLGRPLRTDPELLAALEERFRARGLSELPPANRGQAEVPAGATALRNPAGTAPGLVMDAPGGAVVVLLPGPPRELQALYEAAEAEIRTRLGGRLRPVYTRTLHTTGIPESVLAPRAEEALGEARDVELAFLPDLHGVDLRLTVRGADGVADAEARLDRAEAALQDVVAGHRYEAAESGDLVEAVTGALLARGLTVATAESCTGGLVAKRLTDRAGSSRVFLGGVVAYSNEAKRDLLGIDPTVLEARGAVSEEVARAMAVGAREALGADTAVSITGIAGPDGGTDEKPVGTVWYAAAVGRRVEARHEVFPFDRESVRARSGQAALALLREMLEEED